MPTAITNLSVKSMFPGGPYDAERTIAVILAGGSRCDHRLGVPEGDWRVEPIA